MNQANGGTPLQRLIAVTASGPVPTTQLGAPAIDASGKVVGVLVGVGSANEGWIAPVSAIENLG